MNGRRRKGKLGIALAGGGPLGGIYEIGALVALEKALREVSLTDLASSRSRVLLVNRKPRSRRQGAKSTI